jgi:hypothetical protein
MSEALRILVDLPDTTNPLGPAWVASLQAAGLTAVGWTPDGLSGHGWDESVADLVVDERTYGVDSRSVAEVHRRLLGPPCVIVLWWGLGSLDSRLGPLKESFPGVPVVLVVDTYPNASRLLSEAREWARAARQVTHLAGMITTSEHMSRVLRRRRLAARGPILALSQPLPLAAHATESSEHRFSGRIVFTGRSDCLFTRDIRMAKDAVGPSLASLVNAGAQVFVQDPGEPAARGRIEEQGLDIYPRMTNTQMLCGEFSDFIGSFDAQLAIYRTPSAVLRRRVSNGLSTRWAFGLANPAALMVPREATFAIDFLERSPIGTTMSDPESTLELIQALAPSWRSTWNGRHREWSAEGVSQSLTDFFGEVAAR